MKQSAADRPSGSLPREAEELMQNPSALKALIQSPETKRLISLLQQQGDLQGAAKQAKAGDASALQEMLRRLGQSREGGDALTNLEGRLERR
ncbi:MAG: hypothetical protein LUC30_06555 [Clostridiales bacterium]|nr:hypothetical protein [Clostridiales bacterium]